MTQSLDLDVPEASLSSFRMQPKCAVWDGPACITEGSPSSILYVVIWKLVVSLQYRLHNLTSKPPLINLWECLSNVVARGDSTNLDDYRRFESTLGNLELLEPNYFSDSSAAHCHNSGTDISYKESYDHPSSLTRESLL